MSIENSYHIVIGSGVHSRSVTDEGQHIVVEIVLLDRTHGQNVDGQLYHLHAAKLEPTDVVNTSHSMDQLMEDNFAMMGTVIDIDKKRRHIRLSNGTTVSYTHLIVMTGNQPTYVTHEGGAEMRPGIQTLAIGLKLHAALRIELALLQNKQPSKKTVDEHRVFKALLLLDDRFSGISPGAAIPVHEPRLEDPSKTYYHLEIGR